jgi:hypothetical protein
VSLVALSRSPQQQQQQQQQHTFSFLSFFRSFVLVLCARALCSGTRKNKK